MSTDALQVSLVLLFQGRFQIGEGNKFSYSVNQPVSRHITLELSEIYA